MSVAQRMSSTLNVQAHNRFVCHHYDLNTVHCYSNLHTTVKTEQRRLLLGDMKCCSILTFYAILLLKIDIYLLLS